MSLRDTAYLKKNKIDINQKLKLSDINMTTGYYLKINTFYF